jgi:general secretion pathway protein I
VRHTAGFTLLEVLVALAVVAIALGAVVEGVSVQTANAAALRDRVLAHWVAMNRVVEWQTERGWPATEQVEGKEPLAGRDWYWSVAVSSTPNAAIRRLDVRVSARAGGQPLDALVAYVGRP